MKKQLYTLAGVAAMLTMNTAALADPGTVQIGQCGTAQGTFVKLQGTDRAFGFGGGDLAATLVNGGSGSVGVTMLPLYDKGKFPVNNFFFTSGTINFKGSDETAHLRVCLSSSPSTPTDKKLSHYHVSDLGNGWSQVEFNSRDLGTKGVPIYSISVVVPDTGNVTVGDTNLNYGTNNSSGGARGGVSTPSTAITTVGDCSLFRTCPNR